MTVLLNHDVSPAVSTLCGGEGAPDSSPGYRSPHRCSLQKREAATLFQVARATKRGTGPHSAGPAYAPVCSGARCHPSRTLETQCAGSSARVLNATRAALYSGGCSPWPSAEWGGVLTRCAALLRRHVYRITDAETARSAAKPLSGSRCKVNSA